MLPVGRDEARRVGARALAAGYRVVAAYASPYPRATETGALFIEALGARVPVMEDARLVPEASSSEASAWIQAVWRESSRALSSPLGPGLVPLLVFAAHEPILSAVASRLLGRRRPALARAELVILGSHPSEGWREVAALLPAGLG